MIVECYCAHAYCDDPEHDHQNYHAPCMPYVYTGPNKRSTDRQRVADGWRKIKGQDICPLCLNRRKENK